MNSIFTILQGPGGGEIHIHLYFFQYFHLEHNKTTDPQRVNIIYTIACPFIMT